MTGEALILLAVLLGLAAALYSTVGHGGASAYLALMALFSVSPDVMRPTALALNLVVAGYGLLRFARAGKVNWRLFAAFTIAAAPMAFVGGRIVLPSEIYRPMVGAVLWLAAARLVWQPKALANRPTMAPSLAIALPTGAALGLLAGLTGTGGGIFLSPLIILLGWENARRTSGVAAAFIFVNSLAGLAGNWSAVGDLPPEMPWFVMAVACGALLGTWLGLERLPREHLLRWLGVVLLVAGAKLLFT